MRFILNISIVRCIMYIILHMINVILTVETFLLSSVSPGHPHPTSFVHEGTGPQSPALSGSKPRLLQRLVTSVVKGVGEVVDKGWSKRRVKVGSRPVNIHLRSIMERVFWYKTLTCLSRPGDPERYGVTITSPPCLYPSRPPGCWRRKEVRNSETKD